jgi:hypothetical protein
MGAPIMRRTVAMRLGIGRSEIYCASRTKPRTADITLFHHRRRDVQARPSPLAAGPKTTPTRGIQGQFGPPYQDFAGRIAIMVVVQLQFKR